MSNANAMPTIQNWIWSTWLVSITDVEVSRDLGYARVFVTYIGGDEEVRKGVVADLNHAAGFLRGAGFFFTAAFAFTVLFFAALYFAYRRLR